ncbi:MAG: LamB/YcsF family protein [Xanthomonadales bacterium]|nr:LamB/YcsF family protein [Xanthomonadales bacterium]
MNTAIKYQIDINCDLGEGIETASVSNDEAIMPFISSCNIACGFHAGSPELMRHSVDLAMQHAVAIGAHPSYNDRENFGRKYLNISKAQLQDELCFQIHQLQGIVEQAGAVLHHVKPHGALYNAAAVDLELANCIATSIALVDKNLIFYGLANSKMAVAARQHNLAFAHEAFIDRAYQANGQLLPRSEPSAVITDPAVVLPRALQIITRASVISVDGAEISLDCDTLCLHGDSPGTTKVAQMLAEFLTENQVDIKAVAFRE